MTETLNTLMESLQHPDHNVRGRAVVRLGDLHDEGALNVLLGLLHTEHDFFVREDIVWSLARFGEGAVPPLIDLLRDANSAVRHGAAHTLSKIGDARAVDGLMGALNDADPVVTAKIAFALGRLGDARAIPALGTLLSDENIDVQLVVNTALAGFGVAAIPLLTEATFAEDWYVRERAADILGLIGDQTALPALIETLSDEEWQVRFAAVTALGYIGGADARAAVEGLRGDADEKVRALVPKVLKRMKVKRA